MYEENAKNSQGIFFPLFLKSHSGDNPIYISRDDNNSTTFLDNKIQSKEFQLQYNKLFNTMTPFIPMAHNSNNITTITLSNSNSSNDSRLKRVEEVLHSIENISILTNEVYIKIAECLFDMIQLTNSLPNDSNDYSKGLLYQSQLIDKMMDYLKPKLSDF